MPLSTTVPHGSSNRVRVGVCNAVLDRNRESQSRNGCYDDVIVRGVRRRHDMWYQELQDPYGMHGHVVHIFIRFHQDLEPIMYGVAKQDGLTKRASSIPSAS
jgi:hypothetical protein